MPSPQRRAPSSFFGSEKWRPPPKERKNHFDCCFFSLSLVYPHAALFWIVVFSHHARAEAVRRRPRHSIACHHLSLALEKWRPLPNERKSMLIVVYFFLSFLGCSKAPKKVPRISLCDCLAPLALLSLQLLQLRAPKKEGFFCCSSFLLSPASSWCARQNLFARRQSAPGGCSDARAC